MRPFEWYNINVYHGKVGENGVLVEIHKKIVNTRHQCEKNKPTLARLGGGGCTVKPAGS